MPTRMRSLNDLPPLWILRHGETTWNVENRLQGRLDSPLTNRGEQQAEQQREILRRAELPADTGFLVSPSGRAVRTAEIIAAHDIWRFETDERLTEVRLGEWQGKTVNEIAAGNEDIDMLSDRNLWKFTGPGCETLDDMVDRASDFLNDLTVPSVIVTHGITSRVLRCLALGKPVYELSKLPGGQGVVHYLSGGSAQVLRLDQHEPQNNKTNRAE
ncbi:MAG: histidine phosphatase family protein [Pseudomonadota bacterium]